MSVSNINHLATSIDWSKVGTYVKNVGTSIKNFGRWFVVDFLLPFALMEGSAVLITYTAKKVYELGLKALGKRENYQTSTEENQKTRVERFRFHCWKVIKKAENLEYRIDKEVSRLLGIRTAAEVETLRKTLTYKHPAKLEVVRMVFTRQIKDSITGVIPRHIGLLITEKLGFKLLGREMIIMAYFVDFFVGILQGLKDFEDGAHELRTLQTTVKIVQEEFAHCMEERAKLDEATVEKIHQTMICLQERIARNPLARETELEETVKALKVQADDLKKEFAEKAKAEAAAQTNEGNPIPKEVVPPSQAAKA